MMREHLGISLRIQLILTLQLGISIRMKALKLSLQGHELVYTRSETPTQATRH
jgi:hypothetical protein